MSKTGLQCLRTYIEAQEDYNKKKGLNKHPYAQYFFRTLLGSVLSSHGLINNSVVSLIASMIISPIGMLLLISGHDIFALFSGFTDNVSRKSSQNIKTRLTTFPIVALLIIATTVVVGYVYAYIYSKVKDTKLPSEEMKSRSTPDGLVESFVIAVACAFALPYGFENNEVSLLIGLGIAVALLPPLVNIGVAYGAYHGNKENYDKNIPVEDTLKYSLAIFLINFVTLLVGLYLYMRSDCLK